MTTRILAGVGALALLAMIIWAAAQADLFSSFALISADPWGLVTLVDLYLGFVLMSIFIWHFETVPSRALGWIVPMFLIGNLVPALWLLTRGAAHLRNPSDRMVDRTSIN